MPWAYWFLVQVASIPSSTEAGGEVVKHAERIDKEFSQLEILLNSPETLRL